MLQNCSYGEVNMSNGSKYVSPKLNSDGFHCPHCGVYAHQEWYDTTYLKGQYKYIDKLKINICFRCKKYCAWYKNKMVYPVSSSAKSPPTVVFVSHQINLLRRFY